MAGFSLGFHYRHQLANLLSKSSPVDSILLLDPNDIKTTGIWALALDFDGVLAGHGATVPIPEAVTWIKKCETVFTGERIFILSNKPTDERILWFNDNFPAIRFISGVPKKPFPDGIYKTAELAGVSISQILMIDDRLLTGCLAAVASGARACYILRPYSCFRFRPFAELFFCTLRLLERLFVRVVSSF